MTRTAGRSRCKQAAPRVPRGFVYGHAVLPIITNIEGLEPAVSELSRARKFWLLRGYASLVYIER